MPTSIDITVPATNANLVSSVIRNNFIAIDNFIGTFITPEQYGYSTSSSDAANTTAIQNAINACGTTYTLWLGNRTYNVTSSGSNYALTVTCSIRGLSNPTSVIKNNGTGHTLKIQSYHNARYQDFRVHGNDTAGDGITLASTSESSYTVFNNVDAHDHTGHGLVNDTTWAVRYFNCKFYDNSKLGIYLKNGGENGIVFRDCESRGNGDSTKTYSDKYGGVWIEGAASVLFDGGIYENNEPWGFVVGEAVEAKRVITIRNIYAELNGDHATNGGFLYLSGNWESVKCYENWISYTAVAATTTTVFYITRPESQLDGSRIFKEFDNFLSAGGGAGTEQKWNPPVGIGGTDGKSDEYPNVLISRPFTATTTLCTITNTGAERYIISGRIHVTGQGSDSNGAVGVYPFVCSKDTTNYARTVTVGSAIVSNGNINAPTMAFSTNNLQVTLGTGNMWCYVEMYINCLQGAEPATLTLNTSIFEDNLRSC